MLLDTEDGSALDDCELPWAIQPSSLKNDISGLLGLDIEESNDSIGVETYCASHDEATPNILSKFKSGSGELHSDPAGDIAPLLPTIAPYLK